MWLSENKKFINGIEDLTGKDDLNLLTAKDKGAISEFVVQTLKKSEDIQFKCHIFGAVVAPLKIQCDRNFLLDEISRAKDAIYRGYLGLALSYVLRNTPEDIALMNGLIAEGIASLLNFAKKFFSDETVRIVENILNGNDEPMNTAAIETLGFIGNKNTIAKIEPFLKSKNAYIKSEAKKAIAKLEKRFSPENFTGKILPSNIRKLTACDINESIRVQDCFKDFHEYSAEFDCEQLPKLWKVYQKKISAISVLDISILIDIFDEATQDKPSGIEIKAGDFDIIKVIVYHFDYDVVRLCFLSNNSDIINELEQVTDKII